MRKWLYLSFVNTKTGKFTGAYFAPPHQERDMQSGWAVKFDDVEIAIFELPPNQVPADHKYHDKMLTRSQLAEAGENTLTIREVRAARSAPKQ